MRPNSIGDARRGARAAACLAFAAALEACAAAGPTARYDSLASELASAHPAPDAPGLPPSTDDPFAGAATLSREALVAAVLDRNPTLRAARVPERVRTHDTPRSERRTSCGARS